MQADDDAALAAQALATEDPEVFGLLVRRHQSMVRDFLRKMTRGDLHLADDLAQETFIRAWQRLASFRAEARFSTWLLGIACNAFRTAHRRTANAPTLSPDAGREPEAIAPAPPHGLRLDLGQALARLGETERAAVLLCCQEGLSHDEAAQALGLPLGTVKTHVLRGREKLRNLLAI